ncbi:hypothetical protein CBOS2020_33550 [Clostridium botulinum]|nr:hypothetical protein CBOS2020_33550 [Clostridium botulinum]
MDLFQDELKIIIVKTIITSNKKYFFIFSLLLPTRLADGFGKGITYVILRFTPKFGFPVF